MKTNIIKKMTLALGLTAIMALNTNISALADTNVSSPEITRTRPWDSIEHTLGGIPESVQKVEYAGSVFYLGKDVTEKDFLAVLAAGPETVRLQTGIDDSRLYAYPVYILWNNDKTVLFVHPIVFDYDDVLEDVVSPASPPVNLPEVITETPSQSPVQQPTTPQPTEQSGTPIFFDELTLLTNDELIALSETAPSQLKTRSAMTMTNVRMTETEIAAWTSEYFELGGISSFELEVVRLINEERAKHNLQPLAIMPHYMQAARLSSQEMYDLSYMAHTSPVYGGRGAFINLFGRNMGGAEAIAGHGTPEDTVNAWLASTKGHREILLSQTSGAIGIGHMGNGKAGITTAIFISGNAQYIGYEITVNEYLNGSR